MECRFLEANAICRDLLRDPILPLLYRAECNLLLSSGDGNPVEVAKKAVDWYQEMYDEVQNHPFGGPHHLALLEQAQDALRDAQQRVADQDDKDFEEEGSRQEQETTGNGNDQAGIPSNQASSSTRTARSENLNFAASSSPPTQAQNHTVTAVVGEESDKHEEAN